MKSKLNCYQHKINYYIYKMCKPHGNNKSKTYSRYKKGQEKGAKAYHYDKASVHKGRQQRGRKE